VGGRYSRVARGGTGIYPRNKKNSAQETTAEAAKKNAETAGIKAVWEPSGPGGQAQIKYYDKHGNMFDAEAAYYAKAAGETYWQPITRHADSIVDDKGNIAYMTPVKASGELSDQPHITRAPRIQFPEATGGMGQAAGVLCEGVAKHEDNQTGRISRPQMARLICKRLKIGWIVASCLSSKAASYGTGPFMPLNQKNPHGVSNALIRCARGCSNLGLQMLQEKEYCPAAGPRPRMGIETPPPAPTGLRKLSGTDHDGYSKRKGAWRNGCKNCAQNSIPE
jgi:hypothetical protein